ncbi:MAG: radical SAM protein, partial [Proteobacteria bacterium]|nr:radical SAM protein [Pseudomonadota bacterium]
MKTVSSLLDSHWYERYKRISKLNIRSSIYDVTNKCNLRCKGCFFFSSDEHKAAEEEKDLGKWEAFIDKEMGRGVNLAILIGGEPTLYLDRVEAFYKRLPTFCATNGLIKVPRDRFPDMMVGISLWGDEEDEKLLRGKDTFSISSKNYEGDPYTYYLYTITPKQIGKTERNIRKIGDAGLKVHMQLLSNDEGVDGFSWTEEELRDVREEMDAMLDAYPDVVISSKYYHKIITTGEMLGRKFGWMECPS